MSKKKPKNKKGGFFKEFREFSLKGNVIDLAVGVIIGGAFQSIVNSIVRDLIMPVIGVIGGNVDYSNMFIILQDTRPAVKSGALDPSQLGNLTYVNGKGLPIFAYGSFLTAVINFLLMALIIFMLVKLIGKLQQIKLPLIHNEEKPEKAPEMKICPYCLSEIKSAASRCPHCTSELDNQI